MDTERGAIEEVLAGYERARQHLVTILQELQDRLGYLPPGAVRRVAEHLALSESDIFGVATFYAQFRFQPPGRHCLKVCQGTACHVRGSGLILETLCRELGVAPGGTTRDREFSLEPVMCVGSCALAPAVVMDATVYGRMTQKRAQKLIERT